MWEYEILFDVEDMDGLTPLERAARMEQEDRWRFERTETRKGSLGYRTKTVKAGPRLEAEIFPIFGRAEETAAKIAKKNMTPEKIQKYNDEKARRNLIQLLDANFGRGDLHITLTYGGIVPEWQRACRDVKNFLARLRRLRAKRGLPELKYIYSLEWAEEGREKRIHCHLVTQGDVDRQEIEQLWGRGYANCDTLQPGPEGLEELGRYIYNQNAGIHREKGKRKYSCSKKLKKPKTRTSDTKFSAGRVRKMAAVFGMDASESRRILEKVYPGYELVRATARSSDVIRDGIYIRALMRKIE